MTTNLDWMKSSPIAHRGLHNSENQVFENTLSAASAAIDQGFNIEVDMHLASDGKVVIFHDDTLLRLTEDNRNTRDLTSKELAKLKIANSNDHIATLDELLEQTNGQTGLVLEMKGMVGQDDGFVESIANSLKKYQGPVAIMSFFHWLLIDAREICPQIPLGLTAKGEDNANKSHKMIADQCDVDFVSYSAKHFPNQFCQDFRNTGKPLICWTIKSPEQAIEALQYCDQITFEGFDPNSISN